MSHERGETRPHAVIEKPRRIGLRTSKRVLKWGLIFGAWTFVAFFYTTQALIQGPSVVTRQFAWRVFVWELYFCFLWLALTPLVLWLSRLFPLVRGQILKHVSLYTAASIILSLIHSFIYSVGVLILPSFLEGAESKYQFPGTYWSFIAAYLHFSLISFWGIILATYLIGYHRAYRERALRAAQLEASLAQSNLQILKAQIQPHFLFNTLNTISELAHENGEVADKMISQLSGLLRTSLETEKAQEISLRQELDFLTRYLEIEKARFEERLNVTFSISSETLDAQVPNMILQPLVENAVRHSIAPRAKGGHVEIKTGRRGHRLFMSVEDDGDNHWGKVPLDFKVGRGLSNTRERLEVLYGAEHRFELKTAAVKGLIIEIEIPFHTESDND